MTDKKEDLLNLSLQKIAKASIIVFIGSIVGMLLGFAGRIIFARMFSTAEYGLFSLGFTIASIAAAIGVLGLDDGVTRQVAYCLGIDEKEKAASTILWSIIIAVSAGFLIFLFVYIFSDNISELFHTPSFSYSLKIFSIGIPFLILINILSSSFQAFQRAKETVSFSIIGRNLFFVLFLIPVYVYSLNYEWGIIAFVCSQIFVGIVFFFYFLKKIPIRINFQLNSLKKNTGKSLLLFSFPLLLVMILNQIMGWTDTILLGFYRTLTDVGLYNASLTLGIIVSAGLGSVEFIYISVASHLFASKNINEIRKSYSAITKWLVALILPLAFILMLYPKTVLNFFFGTNYIAAAVVLQVLTFGYLADNIMGPNGPTLIAIGKTKVLMYAVLVTAIMNIILNIILIPIFGIIGAALATAISLITIKIIRVIKLYNISKVHSFEKNNIKPIITSSLIILILYFITITFINIYWWTLIFLFGLFMIVFIISLILTRSFNEEDIHMVLTIEKKLGINLKIIKKLIKRFI